MKIGCVSEVKDNENRVGITPEGAKELVSAGHEVLIEKDAGLGSHFSNEEYETAGAKMVPKEEAWQAELVVKVKEPQASEYDLLSDNMLFTYFHLSGVDKGLTEALLAKKTTAIAYETVEDSDGRLPLLAPMSGVAGNMAVTIGSYYLMEPNNGRGMQLGKVNDKQFGKVVIIGDGNVGKHAAKTAYGMGASVYIFGIIGENEAKLKSEIGSEINWLKSTSENVALHVKDADVVIGAVLVHGAKAPYVVTEDMVKTMQKGSVIIDVSIDQGGCIETSQATSHSDPVFEKHGVIHYCVTNMPGAYPRTSTIVLTAATLPYVLKLANKGMNALSEDSGFAKGVNTHEGSISYKSVAEDLGMEEVFKEF